MQKEGILSGMEKPTQKIQYFLYARKSTESIDRQAASIEDQITIMKRDALSQGYKVIEVFIESGSAKTPGRLVFNQMLERIKKGEAQRVIAWKFNRLTRNPVDSGILQYLLQIQKIKHIYTSERSYYPEDNAIIMSVDAGQSTQFSADLSKDVKRGMARKAERGLFPSKPPLGYINERGGTKGLSRIFEDSSNFEIMQQVWKVLLTEKLPVQQLYNKAVNEWGLRMSKGKKPSRSQFYLNLINPFYYGVFKWQNKIWPGSHKPMITEIEFLEAQDIIGNRMKPAPRDKIFAYTGLIKCSECGSSITAEAKTKTQKNGNVHNYTYYRCTKHKNKNCSQKCTREEKLDEKIIDFLSGIELDKDFHMWAMKKLRNENKEQADFLNASIEKLSIEHKKSVRALERVLDMKLTEQITDQEYDDSKNRWEAEEKRIRINLAHLNDRVDSWLIKAEEKFSFAEMALQRFKEIKAPEEKRSFMVSFKSNLSLKDEILSIIPEKPIETLAECVKVINDIKSSLEPVESFISQSDLYQTYDRNPKLCGYRDLNPN